MDFSLLWCALRNFKTNSPFRRVLSWLYAVSLACNRPILQNILFWKHETDLLELNLKAQHNRYAIIWFYHRHTTIFSTYLLHRLFLILSSSFPLEHKAVFMKGKRCIKKEGYLCHCSMKWRGRALKVNNNLNIVHSSRTLYGDSKNPISGSKKAWLHAEPRIQAKSVTLCISRGEKPTESRKYRRSAGNSWAARISTTHELRSSRDRCFWIIV